MPARAGQRKNRISTASSTPLHPAGSRIVIDSPLNAAAESRRVDQQDIERIAKKVLRELGVGDVTIRLEPDLQPDRWRLTVEGAQPVSLTIRCGRGTTAQYVRTQIFEQFQRR